MKLIVWLILLATPFSAATAQDTQQEQKSSLPPVLATPPAPPPASTLSAPKTIRDMPIYVYSFLDLRETEYTRKVLDTINSDLKDRLGALNVNGPLLEYRRTPQGEFLSDSVGDGQSSTAVPVRQVIADNAAKEASSGARLRMVIFPARYNVSGAWRLYDIRWVIFAVGIDEPILDYTYQGRHMVMWSNKENAVARSKKILDALFEEMKAKGLI